MTSQYITPEIVKYTEDNEQTPKEVAQNLLEDLQEEQNRLTNDFPICKQLIEEALERFYATGIAPGCELYADVLNQKLIKLQQKLVLPTKLNKINFIGQGACLKQLENKTLCKIQIKGCNSMLDNDKEEELRQSGDVRYKHLKRNLYIELSTVATPIECYKRMAHALAEIRFLILDKKEQLFKDELNDEIKIETEVTGERLDHDPLQIVFNEPMPAPDLNKFQGTETKTPMFSLANKLIELLDETVLNPNFQQTEEGNMNISHDIDSFIVSKEPTNNSLPAASSTSVETINTIKPSTKTRLQSKFKNLNKTKRKLTKSTHKTKLVKTSFKTKDKFSGIFYIKDKTTNKIVKRQISNRSILSRCLKRSNKKIAEAQDEEVLYKPFTIDYLQQTPTELVFEYTPRDIMLSLLETMKNFPVLWEFHDKPFNADFNDAIEEVCQIINDKWSLQIDAMKMRRSINRILRFYRFLFPFENMEKFADYFEICAGYLPSTVNDIPHARCSHCFLCFKYDVDLRKHLVEERDSLELAYKCKLCAEIFANSQEYEFHKHLPHYVEMFYCDQCHERFDCRSNFTRHMTIHEENKSETPRKHICDLCGKKFKTNGELSNHKLYHDEKKFKCHLCPKTYFRSTTLMYHLKRHRNQFDIICEVCGMAFTQQKLLNDHMEKHNGAQITCNICNLKLRKGNIYRHLRTIHVAIEGTIEDTYRAKGYNHKKYPQSFLKKRTNKPRMESGIIPNLTFESSGRQYNCKLCNIPFDRLKFLKDHNAECHTNINKVSCKICDSQIHRNNIRRHYREKHKMNDDSINLAFENKEEDVDKVIEIAIENVGELIE